MANEARPSIFHTGSGHQDHVWDRVFDGGECDLSASAKVIVPAVTPLVNLLPRALSDVPTRIDVEHWKMVTGFDVTGAGDSFTPAQVASTGNLVQTICLSSEILNATSSTFSHHGDLRPRYFAELLLALKKVEERWLLNASVAQNPKMWNGLPAQIVLAATQGAATAHTPASPSGVASMSDIDELLRSAYEAHAACPNLLVLSPRQHKRLSAVCGAENVQHYLNPATGEELDVASDLYCPDDTILALSLTWPYPMPDGFGAPISIEVYGDYTGSENTSPSLLRYAVGVRTVPVIRWMGGQAVLHGLRLSE
jgi:hypothetical protein